MPYKIMKQDDKYAIIKKDTGEVAGDTRKKAEAAAKTHGSEKPGRAW